MANTSTTLSAKDLEITTGDAKRIKIDATASAKTAVVPTSLVKFPTNKTMVAPTDVKFGTKGVAGTEITGSTAAKIDLPTGGKAAGDYTLTFKFADNTTAGSAVVTGTVTQEYKIIDPSNLDKSGLTSAITEASKLVEADYTPATWTDFKEMLDIAKQISTDTEPLVTQEEITQVIKLLEKTQKDLVKSPLAIAKQELSNQIAKVESLKSSDYTEKTWQALQTALTAAKSALTGTDATEESVKAATEALKTATEDNNK